MGDASGHVRALPHVILDALEGGKAAAPALAGQTVWVADWEVRLRLGRPDEVVGETYRRFRLDQQGLVASTLEPGAGGLTSQPEGGDWPTAAQRERMRTILFGEDVA